MRTAPRRHFLPWRQPLVPQAVAFLAEGWDADGPLDLAATLVLVPTRQAGRRLREALAAHAASRGSAVFPPRVLTPEALLAEVEPANTASRLKRTLAWVDVLLALTPGECATVFPVEPPERNVAWALRLAERFVQLQVALGENGHRMASVLDGVAGDFPERDRWAELGELERRCDARLGSLGVIPPGLAKPDLAALRRYERVVLLAVADPLPRVLPLLDSLQPRRLEVVVFADAAAADRFDPWGRPLEPVWTTANLELPAFEQRVQVCAGPADQAGRVAALARGYLAAGETVDRRLGVGVADPEVAALLPGELARCGAATFDPNGQRRSDGALFHLLSALAAGSGSPGFAEVEALARCPDFLAYLGDRVGPSFSAARFLAGLDELRQSHLPPDLTAARRHAAGEVAEALAAIASVYDRLAPGDFPANWAGVLTEIFRGRRLLTTDATDEALQEDATEWTRVLRECGELTEAFGRLRENDWRDIALQLFGESRRGQDKPAGALELQGWLELLFDDSPHLVVAGCNDGFVPDSAGDDAFLPESLRGRLGLKTNAARLARDAYLLQALAFSREQAGRLDLLVGRASVAGDPLRPSRLLLRCDDGALPRRVGFLFRPAETVASHLPWSRAWPLRPRRVPPPPKVAVTALRRWLACPFRFYLQYALGMQAIDAAKAEMDAFDFGSLCHAALEAMGRDAAMRDCTDAAALREFLLAQLEREARRKFGAELSLPLLIQLESARQRLGKFAEVQARERAAGWRIVAVEEKLELKLGGVTVRGRIDRIDRHESGAVRVLDYKTSDSGVDAAGAHLRSLRADETVPEWARVEIDGRTRVWTDLQLPLYRHYLAPQFGPDITVGYITLPKAVGETAVVVWDDFTVALQESAIRCATEVCAAIARGEFWPPREDLRAENDDFAPLFHHGAAASVAWDDPADATGWRQPAEDLR